jgi:hypothetical protein
MRPKVLLLLAAVAVAGVVAVAVPYASAEPPSRQVTYSCTDDDSVRQGYTAWTLSATVTILDDGSGDRGVDATWPSASPDFSWEQYTEYWQDDVSIHPATIVEDGHRVVFDAGAKLHKRSWSYDQATGEWSSTTDWVPVACAVDVTI